MPDTPLADLPDSRTGTILMGVLILLDLALLALLVLSPLSLLSIIWALALLASLPTLALVARHNLRRRAEPGAFLSLRILHWPLWQDATARFLLLAALLAAVLAFAYLAARYPTLPLQVTLSVGEEAVARLVTPARLFLLPVFAFLAWMINGLLGLSFYHNRNEPVLAYLLWSTGLLVQVATLVTLVLTIR